MAKADGGQTVTLGVVVGVVVGTVITAVLILCADIAAGVRFLFAREAPSPKDS